MSARASAVETGPLGPVFISAAVLLMVASPLMRGGNRQIALIALEWLAEAALFALVLRWCVRRGTFAEPAADLKRNTLIAFLVLSPAWIGLVQLAPIPWSMWSILAGRDIYGPLLTAAAGVSPPSYLPISLVPDATRASLLTGLPIAAAFLASYLSTHRQLKIVLRVVVAGAFVQLAIAAVQFVSGPTSILYFGADAGRPVGTFANPNHFADFMAMSMSAYLCLGWPLLSRFGRSLSEGLYGVRDFEETRELAIFAMGALGIVFGIVMSESRGALLLALPAALAGVPVCILATQRIQWNRAVALWLGVALLLAIIIVALLPERFAASEMATSASMRHILAASTLDGARSFWPWGAGWGTFEAVFPRFEPLGSGGIVNHAHHDFAEMLFEGGLLTVFLWGAFAALVGGRAIRLVKDAVRPNAAHVLPSPILCGFGLIGFLLHSLVDFSMHIPANAMLAALLTGAYLRASPSSPSRE